MKPVTVALWLGLFACGGPSAATIENPSPTPSSSATAGRTPTSAVAIESWIAETPPKATATSATGHDPALNTPIPRATPTTTKPLVINPLRPMNIERVFTNLTFDRLTNLAQPNDGLNFLFVTEQRGMVRAFLANGGVSTSVVFLDITDKVNMGGHEEGLLGLAFDPSYESNGFFYVYYSAAGPRRSVLSRFSVGPDNPIAADPNSELTILEILQPYPNHNGGQIAFGPDSYLYLGLGDGGKGGDPHGNGQNTASLLGSIIRIDVSAASAKERYRIPPDNPFVGSAGSREEIWAYGLRNPWRFSFDRETGDLWAADVGQETWEEINIVGKGLNYGWNIMEGAHCFAPRSDCDTAGSQLPVAEYSHSRGCSITGGYVYRQGDLPSLTGAYVYGDFCSGKIWGFRYDGQAVTEHILLAESGLSITSFGLDRVGNLFILSQNSGIFRLIP